MWSWGSKLGGRSCRVNGVAMPHQSAVFRTRKISGTIIWCSGQAVHIFSKTPSYIWCWIAASKVWTKMAEEPRLITSGKPPPEISWVPVLNILHTPGQPSHGYMNKSWRCASVQHSRRYVEVLRGGSYLWHCSSQHSWRQGTYQAWVDWSRNCLWLNRTSPAQLFRNL